MSSDRIIAEAIKAAQDLLSQNLPPSHNLTRRDCDAIPRAHPFAGDTVRLGARQRHTFRVCIASGRAGDIRSFAD